MGEWLPCMKLELKAQPVAQVESLAGQGGLAQQVIWLLPFATPAIRMARFCLGSSW